MSKKWNEFPFSATQNPRPEQHSLKWTNWFTGHRRRLCSQSQQYWCWEKKKKRTGCYVFLWKARRGEWRSDLYTRMFRKIEQTWLVISINNIIILLLLRTFSHVFEIISQTFFFCLTLKKTCVWSHCGERFAVQRINRTLLPLWVVVFFFFLWDNGEWIQIPCFLFHTMTSLAGFSI